MTPNYSPQLHAILSALIEERTGLHFGVHEMEILAGKVGAHAHEVGFESLIDYYYFLRYDDASGDAIRALTDALIVPETYFFRELDQLELIANDLIPLLLEATPKVKILIAGSASGEEPLSLSMLLEANRLLDRVHITATDISKTMLDRGRSLVFRKRALRSPPPARVERFLKVEETEIRVLPELARSIEWKLMNLADPASVKNVGRFDLILCRNVLIYFRDSTVHDVVERLAEQLHPNGLLFVGVSESLLRLGTSLVCEEKRGVFFYRKAR